MNLKVLLELKGEDVHVGNIVGTDSGNACFRYDEKYLDSGYRPISISLPLSDRAFNEIETRNFFEGLLPEGFTRRTVAQWVRADEGDYLAILKALGSECLGAIKIMDEDDKGEHSSKYEELSLESVKQLAAEGASKSAEYITKSHLSLAGATGKVGLYYDSDNNKWYLPIGCAPSTHIVKQSHIRLDGIVANEQLVLLAASKLGIIVPKSFVINTGDGNDNEVLLATERYDRINDDASNCISGLRAPRRLHQEDFAQALGIGAINKYEPEGESYLKKMFNVIREYSSNPVEDQLRLWDVVVFNYLVGNTDGHIKNFSLLYGENMKSLRLAPAYDLLSTIVYGSSTRNMAFNIGGEYSVDRINRESFIKATKELEISEKIAMERFDLLKTGITTAIDEAADELEGAGFKNVGNIKGVIIGHND